MICCKKEDSALKVSKQQIRSLCEATGDADMGCDDKATCALRLGFEQKKARGY